MDIHNKITPLSPTSVSHDLSRPEKTSAEQKQAQEEGVQLSPLSAQLATIRTSLADVPAVNKARVEKIKLAFSEGRFARDSAIVAESMLEKAKELLNACRH
jgi:flagellar biosynthesis anti-sigma factor FlgM